MPVSLTAPFQGIVGSQVLKAFDKVAVRTGLLPDEATQAGFTPLSVTSVVDDHKAYIPGATKITIQITGDQHTGQLLGAQLIGQFGSEVAKRSDVLASAIFNKMTVSAVSDLDLSYSTANRCALGCHQQAASLEQAWRATQSVLTVPFCARENVTCCNIFKRLSRFIKSGFYRPQTNYSSVNQCFIPY